MKIYVRLAPEPQIIIMSLPWYLDTYDDRHKKKIVNKKRDKKQHKFPLRNCTECKKVWQNDWMGNRKKLIVYDDMPKLGIKKETCTKCKNKEGYLYEIT
jgi:hypothetical protein